MANSKIFRNAQNRSSGLGKSKDGYLGFNDTIKSLKKSQTRKCEPYNLLLQLVNKLQQKRSSCYFKIVFSNQKGQVKLIVGAGKNKDVAAANASFFVLLNLFSEKIDFITPINRAASKNAINEKNKGKADVANPDAKNDTRKTSTRSVRFRKRSRSVPKRALRRRNRRVPLKDTVVLKDFNESGAPVPEQFNTKSAAIPKKDFTSIFEDANNNLYDENQQEDILIDNPPGVAKFIGLGVDIDRPSIVASTDISPVITDDSLDIFEQAVLSKKFRIEAVYRNLENVDTEDVESMVETFQEFKALTEDAINSVVVISSLDERIIDNISLDMLDIASSLGFNTSLKLSQIYVQAINDLGNAGIYGAYNTELGTRKTSIKNNEINIDENYDPDFFTGSRNLLRIRFGTRDGPSSDKKSYKFGNFGTFLGYYGQIDPEELRLPGGSFNLGKTSTASILPTSATFTAGLMQIIYYELLLSKLASTGDSNISFLKNSGFKNLSRAFLGEFADPRKALNDVKVPEKLAAIAKFNSANENYFPLEQYIPTASGLNGRTFLDAVVQPAVGSLIEDTDPDFALLNLWTEKTRNSLDEFFKYLDPALLDGGAPIVFNEVILAFVRCVSDRNAKIGTKKHPFSQSMILKDTVLDQVQIAAILSDSFQHFRERPGLILPNIYNTFGYSFFGGQGRLVSRVAGLYKKSGLGSSDIYSKITNYKIYEHNWSPRHSRAINDGNDVSECLNNIYEELSRFFAILENGIMTSIDLLLADAGLITANSTPDYNTQASGFFVNETPVVNSSRVDASRLGSYEATAFSGVPRIYLRTALAHCVMRIAGSTSASNFLNLHQESGRKNLIKAAKVAVENIDPDAGPVRWKVTRGVWPPEGGDFDDLTAEDYNKLVPADVRDALEGELDEEDLAVNDPAEGYDFINSKEGFCPLTLMLEGEDNSVEGLSLVRGNRALFDDHYDQITAFRTRVNKLKHLLEMPLLAFQQFPESLEDAAGKISLDSIKELAQLPGIDGQEIVKFTSSNQIGNMKKSLKMESPSETLRYLPNKHAISENEYFVARRFIDNYMQKTFSDESKATIQTVGIPTGLLTSENVSRSEFSLTRDAEFMFYPDLSWSSKEKTFHALVYMIPGSFTDCDPESSFETITNNARYYIASDSVDSFMSYSEAKSFLDLPDNTAREIFTNHCIDYAITLCLKITTGAEFSEETFRLNPSANRLLVTEDGQKNIEPLMSKFPENFAEIFKEDGIDSMKKVIKKMQDSTISEINSFLGALDCRLITPEDMSKRILSPRIFDRVFNVFAHPDEHYSKTTSVGLKRVRKTIDGKTSNVFQIDLMDQLGNSVKNDHFASYYYKVEKL